MAEEDLKNHEHEADRPGRWRPTLPVTGLGTMLVMLLASLFLHLMTAIPITYYGEKSRDAARQRLAQKPIKVRIVEKKPTPEEKRDDELEKQIIETPQEPTERPDDAKFAGVTDHKAEKETKVADTVKREKAADAGQKGKETDQPRGQTTAQPKPQEKPTPDKPQPDEPEQKPRPKLSMGPATADSVKPKARNKYEAMLPMGVNDLPGAMTAGYQDYVDEDLAIGDKIDISTTEYRYIGYFTNMRKAIELVWNYPLEAARLGLQGEVGLEFAIQKDGQASKITVVKSSGYKLLDEAIVEAIRLASPFSPLPGGLGKEKIVVTGNFRYVLNSFGGH